MHKQKALVSHGIWTILLWWAVELCELVHGIWQNFPWKTVSPGWTVVLCCDTNFFRVPKHHKEAARIPTKWGEMAKYGELN